MKDYSKDLAEAIKSYLDWVEWEYDFDSEDGWFWFNVCLSGRVEKIQFCVDVGYSAYSISANLEGVDFDEKSVPAVSEYLCRINNLYYASQFILDCEERLIYCCMLVDCCKIKPNNSLIDKCIEYICLGVEKYAEGLFDVIDGKASPKEIYKKYTEEAGV